MTALDFVIICYALSLPIIAGLVGFCYYEMRRDEQAARMIGLKPPQAQSQAQSQNQANMAKTAPYASNSNHQE